LQAGQAYTAIVTIVDVAGNSTSSGELTFTTSEAVDTASPIIAEGYSVNLESDNTITAKWQTDEVATAQIVCVSSEGAEVRSTSSELLQTDHELQLSDLVRGANYICTLVSSDISGNISEVTKNISIVGELVTSEESTEESDNGVDLNSNRDSDEVVLEEIDIPEANEQDVADSSQQTDEAGSTDGTDIVEATDTTEINAGLELQNPEAPTTAFGSVDTDGDGVADIQDEFPSLDSEWLDSDNDEIGDNADTDDDNDGMPDGFEFANGLNQLSALDAGQDLDMDGVSNISEYEAGSNIHIDDVPPMLVAPFDVLVNSTGPLTPVDIGQPSAVDLRDGLLLPTVDTNGVFALGSHIVTWSVADTAGNTSIATQLVTVVPLVSVLSGRVVEEGNSISVRFQLNGHAAEYPVHIPYSISGSAETQADHNASSGSVVIESGTFAELQISALSDNLVELSEEFTITLLSPQNAALGDVVSHTIAIVDENVAPQVLLLVSQGGRLGSTVYAGDGVVVV